MRVQQQFLRPLDNSGQSAAVTGGSAATFTTAVPADGINLVAVTFNITTVTSAPVAFFVRVGPTAAASAKDYPITIPTTGGADTVILRCAAGDKISVFCASSGTAYCCWMTV